MTTLNTATTTVDFGAYVSLQEAADLILATPTIRYCLEGEPGIGKSSIMKLLEAKLGDAYSYCYFDCAQKDLGDIAMPWVDHNAGITRYFPNAILALHLGKPVVIMLDEFGKAPAPVQNMLHPMLEPHNPRLGDIPLPPGSIVFIATNLSSDGVGDNLKAHTGNRVTRIRVRKSNAKEWLSWAVDNGVDSVVCAWVNRNPHCLSSYLDGDTSNDMIFNPRRVQAAFVSPRSLAGVSPIIKARAKYSDNALTAAMAGTIGPSAAKSMQTFVAYQDQLPTWENIIKHPKAVQIPESPGACAVLVFGAVTRVDKQSMDPFMDYIERFEEEWQSTFCISLAKTPNKQAIAFSSKRFADWVSKNQDLL